MHHVGAMHHFGERHRYATCSAASDARRAAGARQVQALCLTRCVCRRARRAGQRGTRLRPTTPRPACAPLPSALSSGLPAAADTARTRTCARARDKYLRKRGCRTRRAARAARTSWTRCAFACASHGHRRRRRRRAPACWWARTRPGAPTPHAGEGVLRGEHSFELSAVCPSVTGAMSAHQDIIRKSLRMLAGNPEDAYVDGMQVCRARRAQPIWGSGFRAPAQ